MTMLRVLAERAQCLVASPALLQANEAGPGLRRIICARRQPAQAQRSEEHTSELQSHSELVCRLLLEKKKGKPFHSVLSTNQHPRPLVHGLHDSPLVRPIRT